MWPRSTAHPVRMHAGVVKLSVSSSSAPVLVAKLGSILPASTDLCPGILRSTRPSMPFMQAPSGFEEHADTRNSIILCNNRPETATVQICCMEKTPTKPAARSDALYLEAGGWTKHRNLPHNLGTPEHKSVTPTAVCILFRALLLLQAQPHMKDRWRSGCRAYGHACKQAVRASHAMHTCIHAFAKRFGTGRCSHQPHNPSGGILSS